MRILDLEGSPYDMGYQHGSSLPKLIHEISEKRLQLLSAPLGAGRRASREEIIAIGKRAWVRHEEYEPDLVRELLGIADGAEMDPVELLLMNGYTDFVNVVHGQISAQECTAFWAGQDVTRDGMTYLGQTWDMDASACPYVVALHLYPDGGPAALALSISGCLGLAGINEAGIALVTNNLIPTDTQDGVTFVFLVRKALQQTTLESAVRCLVDAQRSSGHNYLVTDATGRAVNVETSGKEASITLLPRGLYVHTNHYLSQKLRALERSQSPEAMLSSLTRWQRMRTLLLEQRERIDAEVLQGLTADHKNGDQAICRHAKTPADSCTCGAVIMSPQEGKLWAVAGNPCQIQYERLQL